MLFPDLIDWLIKAMLFAGLYLSLRQWGTYRSVQFRLSEMMVALMGHGATLACFHFILKRLEYGLSSIYPVAIAVGLLFVAGYRNGCLARNRLREDATGFRWIVFIGGLLAPVTFIPAVAVTVILLIPGDPFENDWRIAPVWLFLLSPVLIQIWFWNIALAVQHDKPVDG